jgi:metal transporter CNNM
VKWKAPIRATLTPNINNSTRAGAPLWSSATGVNSRESLDLRRLGNRVDWITDFLNAKRDDASDASPSFIVTGVRFPAPLGIITFEDVLDTLLRRTGRDEKDCFERKIFDPPTKTRKEGDDNTEKFMEHFQIKEGYSHSCKRGTCGIWRK